MNKILNTLKGASHKNPPLWLMRQAGRYLPEYRALRAQAGSFLDLCYSPDLATEVTLQPIRRFDFDAAIIFSDILVIAQALGQPLWFAEGEGPKLTPLTGRKDIEALHPEQVIDHLEPVFKALSQTRESLARDKALIGFCGAPFTVASYMIAGGGEANLITTRRFALEEAELFDDLLDLLAEASALYLSEQVKAGADLVQIFDSWIGILDPVSFERFGIRPMEKLVSRFRALSPDVPVIAFPRGAHSLLKPFIERVRPEAVSLDWTADLKALRSDYPDIVFQGNLDPLTLSVGGKGLGSAVKDCLQRGGSSHYIFNLGHGIRPETSIAEVERLVELVRG